MVSFELYVPVDFSDWYYWILVCVCDSNLRKFLVEISDTVGLDRLVVNWLEFIFCVFDDQVYGYPDLFLFFMDDQVCDFLGTYLSFACWIIFSKF